ncbi:hypothetical protein [Geobacter sp. AOG1]|uniref:hypothetical protein n=1 Tax=Geobacter sp. AOG1 TaxID=1566346 RepID=UPI001CC7AFE4|nr:hypothetical protein [Geobacter sp. AOG1]GFE57404.1 hypothetical protein AOG1_12840 [Geobacter sp. AOG1]
MTVIKPAIRRMTFDEAQQKGLFSQGLVLEHQGKSYLLHAGFRDKVHVFTKSICLYVLTINRTLGYIGLDAYMSSEPDPINTIFLHSEYQITDVLGRKWEHMTPRTIASRLIDYLI